MCGIAGFVDLDGRFGPERLRAIVSRMNDCIVHRGPDDAGVWVDPSGRCALAQRRLSILDLSPAGHQPMTLSDDRAGLTYNGEIYNFREIRTRLESQGHRFRSDCDTEVVLTLLADHHVDRLDALNGMFAFGLWNTAERRLLLARDRFGKKPLYCARGNGWFAFASELHALEVIPDLDRTITPDALADYLLVQYFHAPQTIYRGVTKLEPGSWLTVNLSGHQQRGQWFSFDAGAGSPEVQLAATYEDRVLQLAGLVRTATKRRLISDVPLGAFLSGGVDSALIVATMRELGVPTKTYSVGFEDSPESEHVFARQIAERLGAEHHEIVVRPDAIELASMIADNLDEPNGDSSCLPTNLLSEFTRRHVTVALSGDGGDEMFGGYGRYLDVLRESTDPNRPDGWTAGEAYLGPRWTIFQAPQIAAFFGGWLPPRASELLEAWGRLLSREDRTLLQRMRTLDATTYMPGSVLAKVDRMSMRYALEVRCPLLDPEIAAFAAALAHDDCCTTATGPNGAPAYAGKRILKDVLARHLPREWVDRRKRGFGLPADFWDGPGLRAFAADVLDSPSTRLRDVFEPTALKAWLATQQDPNFFSIYRLWPMLMLELWLRKRRPAPVR